MKDLTIYLNEAEQKSKDKESTESWVAVDIIIPNEGSENDNKEKHSKRVVSYNTYMDMKKTGHLSNGNKIISINTISPPCPSKEKAQEYTKK